jgi:hypothetical protein
MKRSIIITIGIVIILLIFGMWVYLFLYGAPKATTDVFTNLGVLPKGDKSVRVVETGASILKDSQLALGGGALQQLTTRAVAGFGFAQSASNILRYVERGTGHVYEVNLESGTEKQVSVTTLQQTTEAVFSPELRAVALTTYEGYQKIVSVGVIHEDTASIDPIKLPDGAENITFANDATLYFTRAAEGKTIGTLFALDTQKQTTLFTIGLTDVEVFWGNGLKATYVLTKPSASLEGALYTVTNNALTPVTSAEFGQTAFTNNTHTITSHIDRGSYITESLTNGTLTQQGILMLKEKCVFDTAQEGAVWCAAPLDVVNTSYVEDWYKGTITSEDYLWFTELSTQSSTLKGDLPTLAGKTLDVAGITINSNGNVLLFGNKIDQTLWMFRTNQ